MASINNLGIKRRNDITSFATGDARVRHRFSSQPVLVWLHYNIHGDQEAKAMLNEWEREAEKARSSKECTASHFDGVSNRL